MLFEINIEKKNYFNIFKIFGGENILDTQLVGNIDFLMSYSYLDSWSLISIFRADISLARLERLLKLLKKPKL